ncbi:MAG TPA: CBS domain-containing protein, partial [Polyangiaceae bacterium]|nr:CBS domain-containing protein [Polyangiaceae bacterium]
MTKGDHRVRDAMSKVVLTCRPEDDVLEAVALMVHEGIRHVPVVAEDGHVIGMVSDRDVRDAIGDPAVALDADSRHLERWPIADIMTRDPITVRVDASLHSAAERMRKKGVGALVVVDRQGTLKGLLSYVDLLRHAYGAFKGSPRWA